MCCHLLPSKYINSNLNSCCLIKRRHCLSTDCVDEFRTKTLIANILNGFCAPHIWKKLPEDCKTTETLNSVKSKI